jgi:hypothetical protein
MKRVYLRLYLARVLFIIFFRHCIPEGILQHTSAGVRAVSEKSIDDRAPRT